jgi:hypothetical protein
MSDGNEELDASTSVCKLELNHRDLHGAKYSGFHRDLQDFIPQDIPFQWQFYIFGRADGHQGVIAKCERGVVKIHLLGKASGNGKFFFIKFETTEETEWKPNDRIYSNNEMISLNDLITRSDRIGKRMQEYDVLANSCHDFARNFLIDLGYKLPPSTRDEAMKRIGVTAQDVHILTKKAENQERCVQQLREIREDEAIRKLLNASAGDVKDENGNLYLWVIAAICLLCGVGFSYHSISPEKKASGQKQ